MKRFDRALRTVNSDHRQESYIGPLASTNSGGKDANVNNLYNSQIRAKSIMPYGISSRPCGGLKAQTIVNDNSDSTMVGVYDPNRPNVGVGEICIYSMGECSIYLSADGKVTVRSHSNIVEVGSSDITIRSGGNVNIDCNSLMINGKSIEDMISDAMGTNTEENIENEEN